MKRSPRLAAIIAAMMLMTTCMAATPGWALLGPIREEPVSIGEPTDPGYGHAGYASPNEFIVQGFILGQWFLVRLSLNEPSSVRSYPVGPTITNE